jgi:hypothetical protein
MVRTIGLSWDATRIDIQMSLKWSFKMDLSEALKFAEECRKNGSISTSAKALIALADEIKRRDEEKKIEHDYDSDSS